MRTLLQLCAAMMLGTMLGCVTTGVRSAETTPYYGEDAAVAARVEIDESDFYRSMAPHGQWSFTASYGWAWHPHNVQPGWRPYTVGRWVWSDPYGWTWASYEPWGWAAYHYGRWFLDPYYGWMWLPGTVWAPAWVGWRVSDGYIGWAPLPPGRHGHDYGSGSIGWSHWNFSSQRDFTSSRIDRHLLDRDRSERAFREARDVTRFEERGHEAVSRGVDRRTIERATGGTIAGSRIVHTSAPSGAADARGGDLPLYRPRIGRRQDGPTPDRLGLAPAPDQQPDRRGRGAPAGRDDNARGPKTFDRPDPRYDDRGQRGGPGSDQRRDDRAERGADRDRPQYNDSGVVVEPPVGQRPREPRRPSTPIVPMPPVIPRPPQEPRAPMMAPAPTGERPAMPVAPQRPGRPAPPPQPRGVDGTTDEGSAPAAPPQEAPRNAPIPYDIPSPRGDAQAQ